MTSTNGHSNASIIDEMRKQATGAEPLAKIPNSETVVSRGGKGGTDLELFQKFAFSAIEARNQEVEGKMYGWLVNCAIDEDDPARDVIDDLLELSMLVFHAYGANLQEYFDAYEDEAKYWLKQMGRGDDYQVKGLSPWQADPEQAESDRAKQQLEALNAPVTVDSLLQQWSEGDATMNQVTIRGDKNGLESVIREYDAYMDARAIRDSAEMRAASLPPPEYQYFWCRVGQFQINSQKAYNRAMGINVPDFTKVKALIADGAVIDDVVGMMPFEFQAAYRLGRLSMADGEEHRKTKMSMHSSTMPYEFQPPRRRRGLGFGFGRRDDDDESRDQRDDRDYDDRDQGGGRRGRGGRRRR